MGGTVKAIRKRTDFSSFFAPVDSGNHCDHRAFRNAVFQRRLIISAKNRLPVLPFDQSVKNKSTVPATVKANVAPAKGSGSDQCHRIFSLPKERTHTRSPRIQPEFSAAFRDFPDKRPEFFHRNAVIQ